MKKTFLNFLVIFLAFTFNIGCKPDVSKVKLLQQTNKPFRYSLSGYSYETTNEMVQKFKNKPGFLNSKTSSWFSKEFIDSLNVLLNTESADGVRIYLAKKPNGKNTFIWVSTVFDGPDPNNADNEVHLDYFKHSSAFLKTGIVNARDDNGADNPGALLYYPNSCLYANCDLQAEHHVDCKAAREWAIAYDNIGSNTTEIETTSEWFGKSYIASLAKELNGAPAGRHPDGIRIYLGYVPAKNKHNFIIATTEKIKKDNGEISQDYYECFVSKGTDDNGEQCPNNCKGATLPQP